MTPDQLSTVIADVLDRLAHEGRVPRIGPFEPYVEVRRPGPGGSGDWSCSAPIKIAAQVHARPTELAAAVAEPLRADPRMASVAIAGPGFLEVTLDPRARLALAEELAHERPVERSGRPAEPMPEVALTHARCCALLRNAADLDVVPAAAAAYDHPRERDLLTALAEADAAPAVRRRALAEVAELAETLLATVRVLPMGEETVNDVHRSRMLLIDATRAVLARGLTRLGLDAPVRG